jgi:protein phosphatase
VSLSASWRSTRRDGDAEHGAIVAAHGGLVYYGGPGDVFLLGADLDRTLREAHVALRTRGVSGMCAAGLVVRGDRVSAAWIGDCRVYRVRAGRAERLSRDQTLAEQLAAEGLIATGPRSLLPLHTLGRRDPLVFAALEEPCLAGDRYALATVGVWRDRTEVAVLDALCIADREVASQTLVDGPSPLESTVLIVDVPGSAG